MIKRENILKVIYDEISQINESFKLKSKIEAKEETVVLGVDSSFDSLALVHLISAIEDWIDESHDVMVVLADEHAIANPDGPFQSIGTLATYAAEVANAELAEQ